MRRMGKRGWLVAAIVGGSLAATVSPSLANWTLSSDGNRHILSGAAAHGDSLRAECGPNGALSFAYIQSSSWESVLGTIQMTLWTSTDSGPKHTMPVTAKKFGDNGVAYTNNSDLGGIYAALRDVRNALVTIHLGVDAPSYSVSWTDTSSAKDSTETTRRFARLCGIDIDKLPPSDLKRDSRH